MPSDHRKFELLHEVLSVGNSVVLFLPIMLIVAVVLDRAIAVR